MITTAQDQHLLISQSAAAIANRMLVTDSRIPAQYIGVFKTNNQRVISLNYDDSMNALGDEIVQALREIGKSAIHQAIMQQGEAFVGLILGESRRGLDYFDVHYGKSE